MSTRNTIYIVDSDSDYRQELITLFATAVEDYKLCGVKNLNEMEQILHNARFKHGKNYLIASSEQFERNGHTLKESIERYSKNNFVQQVIVYSPNPGAVQEKTKSTTSQKFKAIEQNDFTFYRIQNSIRNCVNLSEYNHARVGFALSLSVFATLAIWFYLL
jgi:hypothetical protein